MRKMRFPLVFYSVYRVFWIQGDLLVAKGMCGADTFII